MPRLTARQIKNQACGHAFRCVGDGERVPMRFPIRFLRIMRKGKSFLSYNSDDPVIRRSLQTPRLCRIISADEYSSSNTCRFGVRRERKKWLATPAPSTTNCSEMRVDLKCNGLRKNTLDHGQGDRVLLLCITNDSFDPNSERAGSPLFQASPHP